MRRFILFLTMLAFVSVSAQDSYYMEKAKGYIREAE